MIYLIWKDMPNNSRTQWPMEWTHRWGQSRTDWRPLVGRELTNSSWADIWGPKWPTETSKRWQQLSNAFDILITSVGLNLKCQVNYQTIGNLSFESSQVIDDWIEWHFLYNNIGKSYLTVRPIDNNYRWLFSLHVSLINQTTGELIIITNLCLRDHWYRNHSNNSFLEHSTESENLLILSTLSDMKGLNNNSKIVFRIRWNFLLSAMNRLEIFNMHASFVSLQIIRPN